MRFPAKILWLLFCTVCVAQDCKEPPPRKQIEILSGSWQEPSYAEGTQATYKCRPGYRTFGSIVRQCKGGEWVPLNPSKTCRKRPCGHPGDMAFGSFELVEGNEFVYGAKVVYTCENGYQLLGEINFRECDADGWTNDVPVCEVVKCYPMTEPENGRIISGALELDQEYSFGQVIRFECNPGFMLDRPKEIHCSKNGSWSGEKPNCVEISCKIPEIANGEPVYPKNSYKENDRLQYKCFKGFGYSERAEAICTKFGWSPSPACKEVTCDPPYIPNGYYSPESAKYRLENMITYHCTKGFFPASRGNRARCTNTGWEPPPRCSFKPCDFPEIKHGRLYNEEREKPYFPVAVGKWFYYSCDDNFVTSSEKYWDSITCTREGWKPAAVLCRRKCTLSYLEHGRASPYRKYYLQGSLVSVDCRPGYSLPNQQSSLTCTEDGWSPPPRCIPARTCSKSDLDIDNGFISESESTYALHTHAHYKCRQGYVTTDGQTTGVITCQQSGWSAQPTCIKSCDVPVFENARATGDATWFKVKDRLDYQCHEGYKNRNGHTTGTIECGPNGWSDTPTCRERECTAPDIERNVIAEPPENNYRVGDVLKFSCRNRLKIVGADSAQCYHFGWSPSPPTCKEQVKSCGLHPQLPNGEAKNIPKEEYEHGEVVEYVCKPRFLMKGPSKVQCVDGEWTDLPVCVETDELRKCKFSKTSAHEANLPSDEVDYEHNRRISYTCRGKSERKHSTCVNGRWDPVVSCTEARCPPPPQIPNALNMTTTVNYQEGEEISVLCQENFLMQEEEDMVCRGGTWQSLPRCTEKLPCSQPPHIEHGTIQLSNASEDTTDTFEPEIYPHGTKLSYTCKDGFQVSEKNEITCHMGKWSSPPSCEGLPCGPPPTIPNGSVTNPLHRYEYGATATYKCSRGFGVDGPEVVKCIGQKWSPPPECTKVECSSPPRFAVAKLMNRNTKNKYRAGEEVVYKCPQNFQMDGPNTVRCFKGQWVGSPTCRDISCGNPPIVENANILNKMSRYLPGDTVRYECLKALDPFGNVEVTCLNGNWTEPPQCKESAGKCGPPPPIANGDTTSFPLAVYPAGSRVEYQCQSFYTLEGNEQITCRDGQWTDPPRCLDACVISEEMMKKHKIQLKWSYDKKIYSSTSDIVEFICQRGFYEESPHSAFRAICREGKMEYPTCG